MSMVDLTLAPLPIYLSTQARKDFSASQLVQFHLNLSNALEQVIALPPTKRNTPSTRGLVATYTADAAHQSLEALIWEDATPANHDVRLAVHQRVLVLAEKIASSAPGLELRTLLNLCIAFPSKPTRLRSILLAALDGNPDIPAKFSSEVVPAFTSLLSPARSSGLYGLRKTARCLASLLRASPPALVRPFAQSKEFILSLARAYDDGLTAISRSYGGIRTDITNAELDHWEHIWLDTKVDIVDTFYLIMTTMVQDLYAASRTELAVEAERTFGIVFALLDIVSQSTPVGPAEPVPFLNRSLVADYRHAYDLDRTLGSVLQRVSRDDARMELLESTLSSLDVEIGTSRGDTKGLGVLKLILCSAGIAPRASAKAPLRLATQPVSVDRGKAKATAPEPTHSPGHIGKLLTHPSFPFRGNAERVIEALLEGTAPDENALGGSMIDLEALTAVPVVPLDAPIERRNVFDEEVMDLHCVHVGEKQQDEASLTRDKAEVEQMKAEILQVAEVMPMDEEDEESR